MLIFSKAFTYMLSLARGSFICCVLLFGLGFIYMLFSGLWPGVHLHVVFWSLARGPFTRRVLVFGLGSIYISCSGLWPGVHLVNEPL